MNKLQDLTTRLKERIIKMEAENAKFIEDFQNNPFDALSWSQSTFLCTARITVAKKVLDMIEDNDSMSIVLLLDILNTELLRRTDLQRSTSQTSNLLSGLLTQVYGEIISEINRFYK